MPIFKCNDDVFLFYESSFVWFFHRPVFQEFLEDQIVFKREKLSFVRNTFKVVSWWFDLQYNFNFRPTSIKYRYKKNASFVIKTILDPEDFYLKSSTIKYLSWDNLFYRFYVLHNSFHVSILLLNLKAPNLNSYEFNCHHNNLNLSEQKWT